MKRRTLLLIVFMLSVLCMQAQRIYPPIIPPKTKTISRSEALKIAISLYGESDSVNYYVSDTPIVASKYFFPAYTKSSNNIIILPSDSLPKLSGNYWLIFMDMNPLAGWNHSCKYIYIPNETKNKDMIMDECWSVDSICPPSKITMLPGKINVKYQSKAPLKKVSPKPNSSETANPAAGHTYAVIISGGMTPISNQQRYWNDCSFIYQTLHTTYGVPRNNIKVIMSDGTDPAKDMCNDDDELVSSPLDLDGDGTDDIQYAATKANIKTVFDGFKNLGDNDHLFVFVTDHGGYDKAKDKSYICLWNNERLYSTELDSCLNDINAGYITVLLGQCYSGGFVDDLKRTNRIIVTACQKNEKSYGCPNIPYDEFLYKWTSAVNGADAEGNPIDIVKDKNGKITIRKASRYAAHNDMYIRGKYRYAEENPTYTYLTYSVASDLAFDTIPNPVDLCFEDDHGQDIKSEILVHTTLPDSSPQARSVSTSDVGRSNLINSVVFWNNSRNIWVRNENDDVQENEDVYLSLESHPYVYLNARIRNRGVKPYKGGRDGKYKYLKGFFAEASFYLNRDAWFGCYRNETGPNSLFGCPMSSLSIENEIAPGKYFIFKRRHYFNDFGQANGKTFPMCILGYISDSKSGTDIKLDTLDLFDVWNTDKVVQSNVINHRLGLPLPTATIKNLNGNLSGTAFDIALIKNDSTNMMLYTGELSMNLQPSLTSSWVQGGRRGEGIRIDPRLSNQIQMLAEDCKVQGIVMKPQEKQSISLNYRYYAVKDLKERLSYDIDLALVDSRSGRIIGGETFRMIQEPRRAIFPKIVVISQTSNTATLTVENVHESAKYEWYNQNGVYLGEGETFEVPVSSVQTQYKVKAISNKDGAFNYGSLSLTGTQAIQKIESEGEQVSVSFNEATDCDAVLKLSSLNGFVPMQEYSVSKGISKYDIPASALSNGVYQVSFVEDGKVIDSKKFVK